MTSTFDQTLETQNLWTCQKEALAKLSEHFESGSPERHVLVQLPTGTGKTVVIASLPLALKCFRALVLTPNLKLAKQIESDLDIINEPAKNVYRKHGLIEAAVLDNWEMFVLRLDASVNRSDVENHHIIVANYHQLYDLEKWFGDNSSVFDLIIIDEAHHQSAETYQQILKFFANSRTVGLTATPFRSDGKQVDGASIFTYHFHEAIRDGVIRNLVISNVSPEEVILSFSDDTGETFDLDDILKLKEEAWFNRGIALSQDCCDSIARQAKQKLEQLRSEHASTNHKIIAAAISRRHAREFVKPAFEKLGLKVELVSSAPEEQKTNDTVFAKLEQDKLDVIIHIGMLGEGFNHPKLGVAAIFRPFKSLNPYIQFIGRVIRRNGSTPDCFIVSHLGLNQIARFREFMLFDQADQAFLASLFDNDSSDISYADPEKGERSGSQEREFPNDNVKVKESGFEVISFESTYVKEKVNRLANDIERLSEDEKIQLFEKLGYSVDGVKRHKRKKLKPVDERKASRSLLNEREKSIATDIMNELGVKMKGRDFNRRYENFQWIKQKVSRSVNACLGIQANQRRDLSNEQIKKFKTDGLMEKIKDDCLCYFRNKLSERRKAANE